jgi:hypothetical protein
MKQRRVIRMFLTPDEEMEAMASTPPGTCYKCGYQFRTYHPRNMCTRCLKDTFGVGLFDWIMAIFTFQSPCDELPTTFWGHARGVCGMLFWVFLLAGCATWLRSK